jgi:Ca2+-transporting ATPase
MERDGTWHTLSVAETCENLGTSPQLGLDDATGRLRLEQIGRNELPRPPKDPEWKKLLSQLKDPLVGLLLVAAVIATVVNLANAAEGASLFQRLSDAIAILIIVILNAVMGYLQERRAERALDALSKLTSPSAVAVREGKVVRLEARDLVPGDLVVLETGDRVPADLRLVESTELNLDEAAMTGESMPVTKDAASVVEAQTPLSDRLNMAFMGCTVVRGHGRGVVAETGARTHLGRIGELIGAAGKQQTPLEERLSGFGRGILVVTLVISALVVVTGLLTTGTSDLPTLFLVAVSLAVAVIPEGLPAISTITLALGMQRMARQGALVRRLPAVETLGCATVICSDKTGTLTCNEMTVRELRLPGGRAYTVEGEGYDPTGRYLEGGAVVRVEEDEQLLAALRCGAVCSTSRLVEEEGQWHVIGDPTEGALLTAAAKGGLRDMVLTCEEEQRISEVPFAAERRMMSVVVAEGEDARVVYTKGSPDVLLARCVSVLGPSGLEPLDQATRDEALADLESMATRALRVLGLARRQLEPGDHDSPPPEEGLTWLGLVGMNDPPRPEVRAAIDECRSARVRVVMVTGDHALTAGAIARELGMWDEGDRVLTGAEVREMSPEQLAEEVPSIRVFARVTAEQKMDIVKAYQRRGEVVAVTGDGVNDAPALKQADVGVAMGRVGTDVAREASDMVLADDNFATIVAAVREGRAIFKNIQKFIFFLCSSNAGLCVAVFAASILHWPAALTPLMILWINLVTNGLPALALGVDPPEPGLMREKPRSRTEGLLGAKLLVGTIAVGVLMGVAALWLFDSHRGDSEDALAAGRLAAFMVLGLSPLFHAFNCRSFRSSILSLGLLKNRMLLLAVAISGIVQLSTVLVPPLRPVFRTTADVGVSGWVSVVAMAMLVLPAVEVFKLLRRLGSSRVGQT